MILVFSSSPQISDVQKVISSDTFERPIYAGNAIATVKSSDKIKIFTVRTSAFDAAAEGDGVASVENGSAAEGPGEKALLHPKRYSLRCLPYTDTSL